MKNERYIRFGGWLNNEYGLLINQAYREQAARFIQRKIRAKRKKCNQSVSEFKKDDYVVSDSILKVIGEPTTDIYLDHAKKIINGAYEQLNFQDPDFISNLFKALRLNLINLNQMLMAKSIYDAKEWLHYYDYDTPQVAFYSFDDPNSPYQPKNIFYAKQSQLSHFYRNLKPEDKKYAIINLPKNETILFFLEGLKIGNSSDTFLTMLSNYLLRLSSSQTEQDAITTLIAETKPTALPEVQKKAKNKLIEHIKTHLLPSQISQIQSNKKTHSSILFLTTLTALGEQNPSLITSPQYRKTNLNSPVIAFVLPTLIAETQLQLSLHQEEAIIPIPTAGKISTRMIRALLEKPKLQANKKHTPSDETLFNLYHHTYDNLSHKARPIEITHPGSLVNTSTPHGYQTYPFLLTYHDKVHAWRAAGPFPFFHHLLNLLSEKLLCDTDPHIMNKKIWSLVDMDLPYSIIFQKTKTFNYEKEELIKAYKKYFFETIHKILGENPSADNNLFLRIVIDIVNNLPIWNDFLKKICTKPDLINTSFAALATETLHNLPESEYRLTQLFLYQALTNNVMIKTIKQLKNHPVEYIILKIKLDNQATADSTMALLDNIGLDNIFEWNSKYELCFHRKLTTDDRFSHLRLNRSLETYIQPSVLNMLLVNLLITIKLNEINDSTCNLRHQDPSKSNILFLDTYHTHLKYQEDQKSNELLKLCLQLLLLIEFANKKPSDSILITIEAWAAVIHKQTKNIYETPNRKLTLFRKDFGDLTELVIRITKFTESFMQSIRVETNHQPNHSFNN